MAHMKVRWFVFGTLMVLINLCVIEIALAEYFFQRTSKYPLAIVHYWYAAKKILLYRMVPAYTGIWERDARMGYSHIANARGTHRESDFEVLYTIGKDKERYIPAPAKPQGRILFLGDSFTFGHGVNDDENYPYFLSRHWPEWQIVNKAVM